MVPELLSGSSYGIDIVTSIDPPLSTEISSLPSFSSFSLDTRVDMSLSDIQSLPEHVPGTIYPNTVVPHIQSDVDPSSIYHPDFTEGLISEIENELSQSYSELHEIEEMNAAPLPEDLTEGLDTDIEGFLESHLPPEHIQMIPEETVTIYEHIEEDIPEVTKKPFKKQQAIAQTMVTVEEDPEIEAAVETYISLVNADIPQEKAKEMVTEAVQEESEEIQIQIQEALEMISSSKQSEAEKSAGQQNEMEIAVELKAETEPEMQEEISEDVVEENKKEESLIPEDDAEDPYEPIHDEPVNYTRKQLIEETAHAVANERNLRVIRGIEIVRRMPQNGQLPFELISGILKKSGELLGDFSDGSYWRIIKDLTRQVFSVHRTDQVAHELVEKHTAVDIDDPEDKVVADDDEVEKVFKRKPSFFF